MRSDGTICVCRLHVLSCSRATLTVDSMISPISSIREWRICVIAFNNVRASASRRKSGLAWAELAARNGRHVHPRVQWVRLSGAEPPQGIELDDGWTVGPPEEGSSTRRSSRHSRSTSDEPRPRRTTWSQPCGMAGATSVAVQRQALSWSGNPVLRRDVPPTRSRRTDRIGSDVRGDLPDPRRGRPCRPPRSDDGSHVPPVRRRPVSSDRDRGASGDDR